MAVAILSAIMIFAQGTGRRQSYKGEITVIPKELSQRGDSLYISIDFKMNGVNVDSRQSADFIPVLTSSVRSKKLPEVSIKGRNNYKTYYRSLSLMSKEQRADYEQNAPYSVVKGYKGHSETVNYQYVIPYEKWMADAHLDLQKDDCGCGNINTIEVQRLVDNVLVEKIVVIEPYQVSPSLAYVQPEVEVVKRRDVSAEAAFDFKSGRTDLLPEYMNNPAELSKLRKMIDNLKSDKNINVKGIKIIGYASPEGSLSLNKRLSEDRAKALKKYFMMFYDFPGEIYSTEFGGENWDGLVKALPESNCEYKDTVLSIIEKTSIEEGREKKIMDLHNGVPYRQMLKEIFPKLRIALCIIDYNVKNFDIAEAEQVFKVSPQNLSLNEMYAVANQYNKGSQEFNDVFETAVRMFPNDETANLNAASAALARKDIVSAERYLKKIKSKIRVPEYDNTMGVLEMLKGNYDRAESYFNAANDAGTDEARTNLEEISKKRENIRQIEEQTAKNK